MKQSFSASLKKLFIATGITSAFIIGSAFTVKAQSVGVEKSLADIQYIGADNNSVWFEVKYDNPTAQKISLSVKDDNGIVVYEETFRRSSLSKKIRLMKDDTKEMSPTIVLKDGKNAMSQSFHIKTNSYVVNDVAVTKL